MPNPVVHFEVLGSDGPALQAFYSKAFDWQIDADNPMNYGLVDNADEGIGGGIAARESADDPGVMFYIEVPTSTRLCRRSVLRAGRPSRS